MTSLNGNWTKNPDGRHDPGPALPAKEAMLHNPQSFHPLEPTRAQLAELGHEVWARAMAFTENLPTSPVVPAEKLPAALIKTMLQAPGETQGDLVPLLDQLDQAIKHAYDPGSPGMLAYVPGGGLSVSAVADFYARITNRFVSMARVAPALVALEVGVLRWFAGLCGLPSESGGVFTNGGSMANFSAIVAARHARLGENFFDGTLYISAQTHHSVAKAARLAGFPAAALRMVPHRSDLTMDEDALRRLIALDRTKGKRPFLIVASAGTTNTGAIDPLPKLADIAREEDLWFHVDAAYGGFFRLTERGHERLSGIEQADTIALDPHKTLFQPIGVGALIARDPKLLVAAHENDGAYLRDVSRQQTYGGEHLPDFAHMAPELTRDVRGMRLWLPLHLHGVAAFRSALDEKLDLAAYVHDRLATVRRLEVPWKPQLSTVVFRVKAKSSSADDIAAANQATQELLGRINASGRILLSSTEIDGRFTIRVCIVMHRTHADRIAEALDIIASAVAQSD